jgi:hypothetical protein
VQRSVLVVTARDVAVGDSPDQKGVPKACLRLSDAAMDIDSRNDQSRSQR